MQTVTRNKKGLLITLSVFTSSESDSTIPEAALIIGIVLASEYYSPFLSSIMPDSRSFALSPKLRRHNSLIPKRLCVGYKLANPPLPVTRTVRIMPSCNYYVEPSGFALVLYVIITLRYYVPYSPGKGG